MGSMFAYNTTAIVHQRQKWNPNNFYAPCYFIGIYKEILLKFGKQRVFYGAEFRPEREGFATSSLALAISKQDKKKYVVRVNPLENDVDSYVGYFIKKGNTKIFWNIEIQVLEFTKYSSDIYQEIIRKLRKGYANDIVFCVFINRVGKIPAITELHSRLASELGKTYQKNRQIWFISRTSEKIHTAYLVWPKIWYSDINIEEECSRPNSMYGVTPIEIKSRELILNQKDLVNF